MRQFTAALLIICSVSAVDKPHSNVCKTYYDYYFNRNNPEKCWYDPDVLSDVVSIRIIQLSYWRFSHNINFKPSMIKTRGYPVESHTLQTEDGYILTMHRIPYGKNQDDGSKRGPPVFCLHGLGENSVVWLMVNNQSLGKYHF